MNVFLYNFMAKTNFLNGFFMSSNFNENLINNIQAGAPIIQIISHDTLRIHADCISCANDTRRTLFTWNRIEGLKRFSREGGEEIIASSMTSLDAALEWFSDSKHQVQDEFSEFEQPEQSSDNSPSNSILLLEDAHYELESSNPDLISKLRLYALKKGLGFYSDRSLIFSQPVTQLPVELEKDTQVFHLPLPDRNALKVLLDETKSQYQINEIDFSDSARLIDAALGLSTTEAQLAFAKAAISKQRLTATEIDLVVAEKEQVIKKSGLLEYFHPHVGLDDVGGLKNLKKWLERRKNAYTEEARDFGLEYPKGILMLGLPGTGKSLAAKAVSSNWQLPLLRLDMGKVFGGIVGQSEENIRNALQMAETISPCILWVDEIEKGLSGLQGSGGSDGGTTARVLGTFLTWMQEKTSPVFVLATANHIDMLPPELLRKGRVDEIFFVDLPTLQERIEILTIHLKKRDDRHELFAEEELIELAELSQGFTGAELEEAVKEALFMAFSEHGQINVERLKKAIESTSPLSVTMHETISETRKWITGRAVAASDASPEPLLNNKAVSQPKLKQETRNPFVK